MTLDTPESNQHNEPMGRHNWKPHDHKPMRTWHDRSQMHRVCIMVRSRAMESIFTSVLHSSAFVVVMW